MPDESIRLVHASGECEIDLGRRELRVLGSPVPVGGRAFEVIEVLARSAGELVTKDELMDRVWPGAIVSDNTLQVHAMAVRKALGPYRSLLKTVSGRGYRLLGDWAARRHDAARPPVGLQRTRDVGAVSGDQLSCGRDASCWPNSGDSASAGPRFRLSCRDADRARRHWQNQPRAEGRARYCRGSSRTADGWSSWRRCRTLHACHPRWPEYSG